MQQTEFSILQKGRAWAVHLFTATGVLFGLLAIEAVNSVRPRRVFVLLGLSVLIDGLDGTLAKRFRVREVLPQIDGALLDNIVDFLTYVFVPAYFILAGGWVGAPWGGWTAGFVLMSSCYQFCQSDAKTDDHFFTGFPSYWNVVVLFLYLFEASSVVSFAVLTILSILVFVPIKYIYPSRTRALMGITLPLLGVWAVVLAWVFGWRFDDPPAWFFILSCVVFAYYLGVSLVMTFKTRGTA